MNYLLHVVILACIYVVASLGLNLAAGFAGLLSLAQASLAGIGAYVVALMGIRLGVPFWLSLPCGMIAAGLAGTIVALPSIRVGEDFFALASFGLAVVANSVFTNWTEVTGGPMGLPGVPAPAIFGLKITGLVPMLGLTGLSALACYWTFQRLGASPFGRVLKAIREDEAFARSLGKNVNAFKLKALVLSALGAAWAGGLYAVYVSYIDPTSFTVGESVFMLSIVIVGGTANMSGTVLGACLLVFLPEGLRLVGVPPAVAANGRQILYGALLVGTMIWRPKGLIGSYSLGRRR